ncbi:MAG: NYN domain-containing protein [Erysipelotrichales bacterium]|nr:NYN domain-containing protein [Erysipelotrichales bacterium]
MSENKNIVVLIDKDNFALKYYKILKDILEKDEGDIVIARAYGQFTPEEQSLCNELGINPILQVAYSKGKNATDMGMTISAMKFLQENYDCFCLATSDSDFTPLAIEIRENKKRLIGAGNANASQTFKARCHTFINVDEIFDNQETEIKSISVEKKKIKALVAIVDEIIDSKCDENGYLLFSNLIELLLKKKVDYNPRNYGATNGQQSTFFKQYLSEYYTLELKKSTYFIKKTKR